MNAERRHLLSTASLFAGTTALGSGLPAWAQATATPPASTSTSAPASAATEAKAPPLPALGTPLRLPEVNLFDGSVFRPAQAEGQVLLIYWWASTCPWCALQSPEMQKLWLKLRSRGQFMLTLSIDRKRDDALAYLQKKGYTFPAGYVTPEVQRILPKPKGLPITLVRGRDGRLVFAEKGQMFPEDVEQLTQLFA